MKLNVRKLYTSKKIIEIVGLRKWQDLKVSGRLIWMTDNARGEKLYKLGY